METIRGRSCAQLDAIEARQRLARYPYVALDLGTGDGRYVRHLGARHTAWLVIGVDACRENLRACSRTSPANTLFVIASAQDLPHELHGRISHLTINFPWGSLLAALLHCEPSVLEGLSALAAPSASLEVRLNGGALLEAGTTLEAGTEQVAGTLARSGWQLSAPALLQASALRAFPSTWARRLAHGRDPRATLISGLLATARRTS